MEGEGFYLKRLRRYVPVEWVEVKGRRIGARSKREDIVNREAEALSARIGECDHLIVLCREGTAMDSESFARHLESLCREKDPLTFVIGGPLGVGESIHRRGNETLSISPFTLTHEMSRLILLEQLYRAFTIMRNEKYHK
jgi:23S rRNA (pseudouridine1915-N3)-methyltransferase